MTDIWALGILLFELFHGYAPFRGNRLDVVSMQVLRGKYIISPKVPTKVKELIDRIL